MKFNTTKLDQAVKDFQALFGTHEELYRYGQFYVTNRTLDDILARIEGELNSSVFMQLNPNQLAATKAFFRKKLVDQDIFDIDPVGLLAVIDAPGVPHLAPLRPFFVPRPSDRADARRDFDALWSRTDMPSAPLWSGSFPTLQKAKAAYDIEKDRCWQVLRALSTMLFNKRKVSSLPKTVAYTEGVLAGAALKRTKAPTSLNGRKILSGREILMHGAATRLPGIYATMKNIVDHDGYVHCGVLSGAEHENSKFPQPEHHVLVFAYDTIDGVDAFVFWDPDASRSNIGSTKWGRGFGVLFASAKRLSTAFDDADLDKIILAIIDRRDGDHENEIRRHFYQVYFLQSLPLATRVRLHAMLLGEPQRAGFDDMLRDATTFFALHDIEIVEASRHDTASDEIDGPAALFVGGGSADAPGAELSALCDSLRAQAKAQGTPFQPRDVLVAVAPDLVPACRATSLRSAAEPAIVLSGSLAGRWTLAHALGHVLGLDHRADAGALMAGSVEQFDETDNALTDAELATIQASPLVVG